MGNYADEMKIMTIKITIQMKIVSGCWKGKLGKIMNSQIIYDCEMHRKLRLNRYEIIEILIDSQNYIDSYN